MLYGLSVEPTTLGSSSKTTKNLNICTVKNTKSSWFVVAYYSSSFVFISSEVPFSCSVGAMLVFNPVYHICKHIRIHICLNFN